jgi:hypothetical protein
MRLLAKSVLRHMKSHLPQTILTFLVTMLVTGALSVLFFLASSFQVAVRNYALEDMGTYHYKYETDAGTASAELLAEMAKQFGADDWFSDVELTEDGNAVTLTLTVAHPGFIPFCLFFCCSLRLFPLRQSLRSARCSGCPQCSGSRSLRCWQESAHRETRLPEWC